MIVAGDGMISFCTEYRDYMDLKLAEGHSDLKVVAEELSQFFAVADRGTSECNLSLNILRRRAGAYLQGSS